jgi:hypothetical protein
MMSSYIPRSQHSEKRNLLYTNMPSRQRSTSSYPYRAELSATGHFHVTDSQKVRTSLSRAHALTANASEGLQDSQRRSFRQARDHLQVLESDIGITPCSVALTSSGETTSRIID